MAVVKPNPWISESTINFRHLIGEFCGIKVYSNPCLPRHVAAFGYPETQGSPPSLIINLGDFDAQEPEDA